MLDTTICFALQLGPAQQLQRLQQEEKKNLETAEALLKVQEGLTNGRKWLWDEAARKLGTLLSSSAAFEGQHFLQVSKHCLSELFMPNLSLQSAV